MQKTYRRKIYNTFHHFRQRLILYIEQNKMVVKNMNENKCLTLGMKAPDFSAQSTFGPLRLSNYTGKWVVLFSHPGDFTPV